MAVDLRALRTAATRERKELAQAQTGLVNALRAGEAVRERGGKASELRRADAKIGTAATKVTSLPDRIRELIAVATPDEVLGALERDVPIVLLPVRLETRVLKRQGGWDLGIRVFPDPIHGDAHERDLTEDEHAAGLAFWARPAGERQTAWLELSALLGAQRAAWVAEAKRPGTKNPPTATALARFTRPAWTQALPDHFLFFVTADGKELPVFEGARVRSPLATGPDPRLDPDADDGTDAGMRWMTDFAKAVTEGMGARVSLGATAPKKIDEVLAFGVRASVGPADTATLLGGLLDAHRYGDGLEVLRAGTPSNAGGGAPAGRAPRPEATPVPGGHTIATGADGARLARALGVDPQRLAGLAGADATSEADAQAMLTALWPGTFGYFLRQMLANSVSEDEAALLRAHAVNWVRGRGPLAPLRAGRNPYGVLPATSLARYAPDAGDPPEAARLLALLRGLLPAWVDAADEVPKAGRGAAKDASKTLAEILGLAPVGVGVDARRIYPEGVVDILSGLGGMNEDQKVSLHTISSGLVAEGFKDLGVLGAGDELARVVGGAKATTVRIPRVQAAALSATAPLVEDYLTFLRTAPIDEIARAEERYGAPLLYLLARYALLQQYARAAVTPTGPGPTVDDILDKAVIVDIPGVDKPKLAIDILNGPGSGGGPRGGPQVLPVGEMIRGNAAQLAGHVSMGGGFEQPLLEMGAAPQAGGGGAGARFAIPDSGGGAGAGGGGGGGATLRMRTTATRAQVRTLERATRSSPGAGETAQVLAALAHLAPLPSAALDRLLRETLDLASHRLDAWVTSLATERLSRMRASKPTGAHLGAYGVVRDLAPKAPASSVKPPGSPAGTADAEQTANQGFLHAPSLGHAATAAVLRSAHAAHGDGEAFAVTLDSARVRRGLELLDGVRQGQSLAALLGYQLERALFDRGAQTAIAKLRDAAPLRTSALPPPAGSSFETIAPRDVVDGLRVARDDFTLPPSLTGGEPAAVAAAIAEVRDALDATGDLLLAEGVHQLVAGTPARAAAATRAAAGTAPPPDRLDVIATPRSGTGITHRVLLVSDVTSGDWVAPGDETPRVLADPLLEGWAARLLGPAKAYGGLVEYTWPVGKKEQTATLEILVEELGIGAMDAVAMSSAPAPGQVCELERRVLDRAMTPGVRPAAVPADAVARLASRADHVLRAKRTPLADLVVSASALSDLLQVARAPDPHELDPSLALDADGLDAGELSKRLSRVRDAAAMAHKELAKQLEGVADEDVKLEQLLGALREASLVVSAALPEVADEATADARAVLVPQARGIQAELAKRLKDADGLIAARSLGAGTAGSIEQRREVAAVLIDQAPPMAPVLEAAPAATLEAALAAPPSLGTGVTSAGQRASVVRAFLARTRAVRRGVARLDAAESLGVAAGGAPLTLRVAQPGPAAGAIWGALPQDPFPGGLTSLVLAGDAAFAAATPAAALVIDDWTEVVPRAQEVTALAVHTDRPGNDAPQAVLVAVPPDKAQPWSVASLRAVLDETLALAEVRMVDPPALGRYGHLLPALLLACTGRQAQIKVPEKWFFPKGHHR